MNRQIKRVLLSVAAFYVLAMGSVTAQVDQFQLELPSDLPTISEPEELASPPVNINIASEQELADKLKGVGIRTAAAIVEYRDTVGLFETPEEIKEVSGIGKITFEVNKDIIIVE